MEELYKKIKPEFEDNLLGLIMYGSRVTNCAKEDSDWDVMVVTKNVFRCKEPLIHKVLNIIGPNFYSRHIDDKLVSLCVTDMKYIKREFLWGKNYITGRLQKPVKVFTETKENRKTLEDHIDKCRERGAYQTLALLGEEFTITEFLTELVSISYKMDFRFDESKKIALNSMDKLVDIYTPYLSQLGLKGKILKEAGFFVNNITEAERMRVYANIYANKLNSLFMGLKGILTYDGLAEEFVKKLRRIIKRRKELEGK